MRKLRDNIFHVGTAGSNAYLVKGEKTALIDAVREEYADIYIQNIEEIMPVSEIDYIIFNHTEPNCSGAAGKILEINPDIEVVGTIAAIKNLKEITNTTFNEHIAKNGAVIDLGNGAALRFCIVPNLNWPDTMATYSENDRVLFSGDIFGSNYIGAADNSEEYNDALKAYFDDIISPFKPFAAKAMEKISLFEIDAVYPSRGAVIENNADAVIKKYAEWSKPMERTVKTASVFYVSEYGYTAAMADTVCAALSESGFEVKRFNAAECDEAEMLRALNASDALAFGTHTINRNAAKPILNIISSLDLVSMNAAPCMVFGSYGWSGEGIHIVHNQLAMMRLKPFEKPFGCILKPSRETLGELERYTRKFADRALTNI
ncbi:MAG: FprA family A-type flavoprotein [Firmicutes bacterium]|nr:FprA family A-type flavoprotein [Bacillota bacterium]